MRVITKTIIALAILCICAILIVPFGMGYWLEKNYHRLFSFNKIPDNMHVDIVEFKRGWFKSHAKVKLTFQPNNTTGQRFSVTSNQAIYHGPFIFSISPDGKKHWFFAKALIREEFNAASLPINLFLQLKWNGSETFSVQIPQGATSKLNHKITIDSTKGTLNINQKADKIKGSFTLDDLLAKNFNPALANFQDTLATLHIENLAVKVNVQRKQYVWYGKNSLHLKRFDWQEGTDRLLLQNVKLATHAQQEKKDSVSTITADIDQVNINHLIFKPVNIQLQVHTDTQARNQFNKKIIEIEQSSANTPLPSQLSQIELASLNLASKGLSIKLNKFNLGTSAGMINAAGSISYTNNNNFTPMNFIFAAHVQLHLQIPKATALKLLTYRFQNKMPPLAPGPVMPEQTMPPTSPALLADQYLQSLINSGMLINDNNMLKTYINFSEGRLLINGKPPMPITLPATPPPTEEKNNIFMPTHPQEQGAL